MLLSPIRRRGRLFTLKKKIQSGNVSFFFCQCTDYHFTYCVFDVHLQTSHDPYHRSRNVTRRAPPAGCGVKSGAAIFAGCLKNPFPPQNKQKNKNKNHRALLIYLV